MIFFYLCYLFNLRVIVQELTAMMEKLELSHEMEAAERAKLEQEIRAKQEEVQRIQSEVEAKDAEARRLQAEFEAAKYSNFPFFHPFFLNIIGNNCMLHLIMQD